MGRFEYYLNYIGNKITIKDEDRPVYTKDFEIIRDYVINLMKRDAAFRSMYRGPSLFGSYADNVRINKPDEFDVIFTLSFPYSSWIEVSQDEDRPGFVNLDFEEVMSRLETYSGHDAVYELLKDDLVDWDNDLLRLSNLRRWIREIIEDGLEYPYNYVKGARGDTYKLEYSKRGLAHTIFAHCPRRKISIDFIPGIVFGREEWMQVRPYDPFKWYCERWYAVPKPTAGPNNTKVYAFMMCNPKVEHRLLLKKQNLKVVFRLLKSLRKKYDMPRLKSYFLTTVFLWEIDEYEDEFWYNELSYILVHMLFKLSEYFSNGFLPFFWDQDLNLLDVLYEDELEDYADKLENAYNTLKSYSHQSKLTYKACLRHFEVPDS